MVCCFTIWSFPGTPRRPTPRGLGHGRAAEATWIRHPKSIGVVPAMCHHHCCSASSLNGFRDQNWGFPGWMDMNGLFSDFNGGSMISGDFPGDFPLWQIQVPWRNKFSQSSPAWPRCCSINPLRVRRIQHGCWVLLGDISTALASMITCK